MIEESVSSTVMFTFPASAKYGWPRREKPRERKSAQNADLLIQNHQAGRCSTKKRVLTTSLGIERKERDENEHEGTLIPYFIRV
jgi:hypothetical protein